MSQVKVTYILKRPKKVASNLITLSPYERVIISNPHKPSVLFMGHGKTAQGLHCWLIESSFKI